MDEGNYYEGKIDPGQRKRDGWGGRMGTVMIFLVLIVVSIMVLNRVFIVYDGENNSNNEIPDFFMSDYINYVSDGDTFETVDGVWVRLLGINTEEKGMPYADSAKNKLIELLGMGEIRLESDVVDKDMYDRSLRYVFAGDTFVNLELVRQGYAHVYVIPPNTKYWDELKDAEQEAIAAEIGLWQPSPFDVTITDFQPIQTSSSGAGLNVESITFKNNGTASIDMSEWTLKDEGTRIYHFDTLSLAPGASVTVHSGEGTDSASNLYWQRTSPVWNNDGDVCFLRDSSGLLVVSWRYEPSGGSFVWEKH